MAEQTPPSSPNWRGLFGSLFTVVGMVMLLGSGLCTAGFGLGGLLDGGSGPDRAIAEGVAFAALIIGLPTMLLSYVLYRVGRRMWRGR